MGGNTWPVRTMSNEERLMRDVEKTATCWLWRGSPGPNGYGRIMIRGREWLAHRLSYSLFVGALLDEMEIDHLCRNRGCVNPAHLEQVTGDENKRRARKTHCREGHALTDENSYITGEGRYRHCRICSIENAKRWNRKNRSLVNARQRARKAAGRPNV